MHRTRARRPAGGALTVVVALGAWSALSGTLSAGNLGAQEISAGGPAPAEGIQIDAEARSISFSATLQSEAFRRSLPPDHQYHALVHAGGSASGKALFVTPAADSTVARVLRQLGAEDGGGVPMSAWNLRWLPLVPQPAIRVSGSRIEVRVSWEGAPRSYTLDELLDDPGERGVDMRFGGNEVHAHEWDSGCILCLFSCPGGVASNAAYTIRDHQRSETSFTPGALLPPDGTRVRITLTLAPG
jgi:hypothetical protein